MSVAGKDMTFNVDAKTTVVARGGSTKTREPGGGKDGTRDYRSVKTGEAVEVAYHEAGMHADTVRAIARCRHRRHRRRRGGVEQKPRAMTATRRRVGGDGKLGDGQREGGDVTFTVDNKTVVSGTGLWHAPAERSPMLAVSRTLGDSSTPATVVP